LSVSPKQLGAQPKPRLAHFLCEVSHRLQLSGRDDTRVAFEFPQTQRDLADTLGLSTVHVNRTLRSRLAICDKEGLYEIAEFDPQYLDGLKVD
jgi:hypothetical protein